MRTQRVISIVRCHAEGEVGDVIVGGVLPPPGRTMFERMTAMQRDQDGLRRLLLCEPRGSVARHINLITPPARDDCDIGMITMEPTEFVPMSGSNLICTVTVALETGILAMHEPETIVRVDTAGGTQWMGFRPSLPDSLPAIGPAASDARVTYAFGHGHLGLTQAASTARLVADLLAGRPSALDLSPFRPQRFA